MNSIVYWRSALGLFWAFVFCVLLALVVGMTYLSKMTFYPYAIFLSIVLIVYLTAFLLFDKRIRVGFYMCIVLSALFVLNQFVTLYFLFFFPSSILPPALVEKLAVDESILFPVVVAVLLLVWAIFLFVATVKSKPVFEKERQKEQVNWLIKLREQRVQNGKAIAEAREKALKKAEE